MGTVQNRRATVALTFHTQSGPDIGIDFVVDTAFQGYLTLPVRAVSALNLPFWQSIPANLADGNLVSVDVHVATIMWHGIDYQAEVLAMGNRPLLGVALLDGNLLTISYEEGGMVSITPLAIAAP